MLKLFVKNETPLNYVRVPANDQLHNQLVCGQGHSVEEIAAMVDAGVVRTGFKLDPA